ncbi:MAG: glycosyltransferase [Oscillospiraceae bacterium]|nr:glycosyltransferase [Oscillospiraceae bacterium]
MELCVVASNYPTPNRQALVFVENVVVNLVDRGIACNVIAPQSSFTYITKKNIRRELVSERTTPKGNKYTVYSPLYTIYPMMEVGSIHFNDKSKMSYYRAVKRTFKKYNLKADVMYSHFFQAGIPAVKLAKELGIPSIVANGEAETIRETSHISRKLLKETLDNVSGIISVSSKNKDEVCELCEGDAAVMDKVTILPNATEPKRFFKKDKAECRSKLGLPQDAFIVAFTGSFIERKGIMKLSAALDRFDDAYSMFIGAGEKKPTCKNVLHMGSVRNCELCDYLNAADVFVLPTLAEGCCNAILEAMACGVPIVSSNRSFNNEILDVTNSILIDPLSEEDIYQAIKELKENPAKRERLSTGCLEKAKDLTLDRRVDKILDFIRSKMKV